MDKAVHRINCYPVYSDKSDPDLGLLGGGGGRGGEGRGGSCLTFHGSFSSFCQFFFFYPEEEGWARGQAPPPPPGPSPRSATVVWFVLLTLIHWMVIYPGAWLEMADVEVLRALPNTTTHLLPSEGMKLDYLISSPVHLLLGDHIVHFFFNIIFL